MTDRGGCGGGGVVWPMWDWQERGDLVVVCIAMSDLETNFTCFGCVCVYRV